MRRVLGLLVVVAVLLQLWRRRRAVRREHVHLEFDDGSTVTLAGDSARAARLLALARQAL